MSNGYQIWLISLVYSVSLDDSQILITKNTKAKIPINKNTKDFLSIGKKFGIKIICSKSDII